jgi:hypothetical protein
MRDEIRHHLFVQGAEERPAKAGSQQRRCLQTGTPSDRLVHQASVALFISIRLDQWLFPKFTSANRFVR